MSMSHHNLVAWQRADDLLIKLHRLSLSAFPVIERFALSAQLMTRRLLGGREYR